MNTDKEKDKNAEEKCESSATDLIKELGLMTSANSFKSDDRVLLVDDLLATGGTFAALAKLVKEAGGNPVGAITVIRLYELEGEKNAMVPCSYLLNLSDSL